MVTDRDNNPINYPWDIFSETSYYPTSFSWANEYAQIYSLETTIQSHARVYGWHYGDEPYGGYAAQAFSPNFRSYIHDSLADYIAYVESYDTQYKHPSYINIRCHGNYYYDQSNDVISPLPDGWINKLDIHDYIFDSSNYRYDIEGFNPQIWERGVYAVESLVNNGFSKGYGKGYCRFIQSKNIGDATRMTSYDENCYEKDRYLAYSSWVCGGQGLMFFRYDSNTTQNWFEYNGNGICTQLLKEAYTMRNWLMNSPATNILSAYAYDSLGSPRVPFILRRDQTGGDSRVLVLFCNFANDGQSHTTYIHFPNQAINTIAKVNADMKGTYSKENSDHTLKFVPDDFGDNNKSIYGSACFITFQ